MAIYDKKPSIYEANGDGSYTYRWDIKEVEIPAGADTEETTTKWECQEVVVWGTVTSDKLTEAVINHLWPRDYEQKLINEYNAATMGYTGLNRVPMPSRKSLHTKPFYPSGQLSNVKSTTIVQP